MFTVIVKITLYTTKKIDTLKICVDPNCNNTNYKNIHIHILKKILDRAAGLHRTIYHFVNTTYTQEQLNKRMQDTASENESMNLSDV